MSKGVAESHVQLSSNISIKGPSKTSGGDPRALSGTTWLSEHPEHRFLEAGARFSPCPRHRTGSLGIWGVITPNPTAN